MQTYHIEMLIAATREHLNSSRKKSSVCDVIKQYRMLMQWISDLVIFTFNYLFINCFYPQQLTNETDYIMLRRWSGRSELGFSLCVHAHLGCIVHPKKVCLVSCMFYIFFILINSFACQVRDFKLKRKSRQQSCSVCLTSLCIKVLNLEYWTEMFCL